MLACEIHTCPVCSGAVNREHFARVNIDDRVDEFLYCAFCGLGWERSIYGDDIYPLDFNQRTEPKEFGKFLQRLKDARAA